MEKQSRRGLLKNAAAAAVAVTGAAALAPEAKAQTGVVWEKKAIHRAPAASRPASQTPSPAPAPAASPTPAAPKGPPLFNGIITFGNLVFIAGIGAHFQGTIEEHTKHVLDELEQNLILAGSSMEKVLKVNVYLSDLANYTRMNAVYAGRWGNVPPVRTTIAAAGGIPGDSLVEIDCIASI
jgi:2-iminobutanoate/2-iminopropanoate deaminase